MVESKTLRQEQPSDNYEDVAQKDRRGRRISLSCLMFFFGEDDFEGEAQVRDISTNGCRASSAIKLEVGMALKISLFLPDFKWPLRIDQAIVRWTDDGQFGLEFTSIRLAQRERLRTLIRQAKP
jgi:PilZ domain